MAPNDLVLITIAITIPAFIAGAVLLFRSNLRVLSQAQRSASTDPLTGLGNRTKFMEDLEDDLALAESDSPVVVALLDLDGFKRYNDAFGHPAGDALLGRLGQALRTAVVPWGSAYRLGGDEFCVVVRDRSPGLETIVSTAAAALSERGDGFAIRPSCGMVALPDEASTPDAALELAERRLYVEKNGRVESRANKDAREVLDQALREREPERGGQLDDVPELARATGRTLGLDVDELDVLIRAAELHDLGKVAVPDTILSKPGPLTDDERAFFRQHTVVGDRILNAASAMAPVARLVRSTRERFDGGGYPDGLSGEEIPVGARVIAVCDAFHAMTSNRPYRRAVSPEEACAELRASAGGQFDPEVVEAFCSAIDIDKPAGSGPGGRSRRLSLLASSAILALGLFAPSAALATTASIGGGGQLNVIATGETNQLSISQDGSNVRIAETGLGATLTPSGPQCTAAGVNQVVCPLTSVTSISVDVGFGNDEVTVTVARPATLQGGSGDDRLTGGPSNDTVSGGADDDRLTGGGGADAFVGGTGDDFASWADHSVPVNVTIDGLPNDGAAGEMDDVLTDVESVIGGSAADTLTGNSLNNGLDGGPGADTLNGGGGDDYAIYWSRTAPVHVDFDGDADDGEAGENDRVGADMESAIGGAGDDTLIGGPGVNNLYGWTGNDKLDGGAGADVLWGSAGVDEVTYAGRTASVTANLDNIANDGEAGEGDRIYDVENLTGGSGPDTLTGNGLANVLRGGPGKDVLSGGDGDDEFRSRDNEEDDVTCGTGWDSVSGDFTDLVATDCDAVERAEASQSGGPEDPVPPVDVTEEAALVLRTTIVSLNARGNAVLPISCPTANAAGCKGTITIRILRGKRRATASLSARRKARRSNVIGRGRFDLEAGEKGKIEVRISRNGRRRVLSQRRVRCKASIATRDENGNRSVTTQVITLKAPDKQLKRTHR